MRITKKIKQSIQQIVNYNWEDELEDARIQDGIVDENHIFYDLVQVNNFLNDKTDDYRDLIYGKHPEYMDLPCTLDGNPAKILKLSDEFALICTLDGKKSIEYSWGLVEKVMKENRQFESYIILTIPEGGKDNDNC